MLTGRLTKDNADHTRVTVDFTQWLDTNETISSVTTPTVVAEQSAVWQFGPFTPQPPPPIVDSTPVTVQNSFIIAAGLMVQLILTAGTPGVTDKVTFVATGSSSFRQKQIDILVNTRYPE